MLTSGHCFGQTGINVYYWYVPSKLFGHSSQVDYVAGRASGLRVSHGELCALRVEF